MKKQSNQPPPHGVKKPPPPPAPPKVSESNSTDLLASNDAGKLLTALSLMVDAGCEVPSEIDGDIYCHYCAAYLGGGEHHNFDCAYKNGRELILKILAS